MARLAKSNTGSTWAPRTKIWWSSWKLFVRSLLPTTGSSSFKEGIVCTKRFGWPSKMSRFRPPNTGFDNELVWEKYFTIENVEPDWIDRRWVTTLHEREAGDDLIQFTRIELETRRYMAIYKRKLYKTPMLYRTCALRVRKLFQPQTCGNNFPFKFRKQVSVYCSSVIVWLPYIDIRICNERQKWRCYGFMVLAHFSSSTFTIFTILLMYFLDSIWSDFRPFLCLTDDDCFWLHLILSIIPSLKEIYWLIFDEESDPNLINSWLRYQQLRWW